MSDELRLRRWRLILGENAGMEGASLDGMDVVRDRALSALYDSPRKGGLGPSQPSVAAWLGDIRNCFPNTVVQVMQQDAVKRLNLHQLLLERENLAQMSPDVNLVATLLQFRGVLKPESLEIARQVIREVVEDLMRRLESPMLQAMRGALRKSARTRRPKLRDVNWDATIRANLRHYQPDQRTIVPERQIGYGRKSQAMKHVILAMDQSGSMATSLIYSGVYAAVMATLPAVRCHVVAFDTSVVDLTDQMSDPVELLMATRLGGGTDIDQALAYCQSLVVSPSDTVLVLISDLIEGGNEAALVRRAHEIVSSGVNLVTLLALSDEGAPVYDHDMAREFASLGSPAFACTPDLFPEVMAAAIRGERFSPS